MHINWLHLSDWHHGEPDFDRTVMRDALLDDLNNRLDQIDSNLKTIDFVIFTGDLTWAGKPKQFADARDFLLAPVLTTLGLSQDRLFVVPGNHDFDLDALEELPNPLLKLKTHDEVKRWLTNEERRSKALEPFKAYKQFVSSYTNQNSPDYASFTRLELRSERIAILCLNSAWMCGRHKVKRKIDDNGYLVIGEPQVYEALEKITDETLTIVALHHPFSWLANFDADKVEGRIRTAADFVLHGHEHRPSADVYKGTAGDCVIIPAGATFSERTPQDRSYSNSYNIVHLNLEEQQGKVLFRRWSDQNNCWVADTDTYLAGKGTFEFSFSKKSPPARHPQNKQPENHFLQDLPFVGLNRVRMERYEYFGGRDSEIDEVIGRIARGQRFLVIYGISGVGKSSLLAAGVLGRLIHKKALPDINFHWQFLFVRPESNPFERLADRIIDSYGSLFLDDADHLAQHLKKSPAYFQPVVQKILASNPEESELVIAIDQLEELFTRANTEDKRRESFDFLQMLADASENLPIRILGTIRDDYLGELSRLSFLINHLNKEGVYCLPPLSPTGLYEAIRKPLKEANWRIEPGLAERIVNDAGFNPGALPLVALCMASLQSVAEKRGEAHLRKSDYEALGGLQGVIRVLVGKALEEMGEAEEGLLHRLFFHLVRIEGEKVVRHRFSREELRDEPVLENLADKLINERLLTGGEENSIEISHDSLFEIWDMLRSWIEKNREFVIQLREMEERWAKYIGELRKKNSSDTQKLVLAERNLLNDKNRTDALRELMDKNGAPFPKQAETIKQLLKQSEELIDRIKLGRTIQGGRALEISQLLKRNIKLTRADVMSNHVDQVFYAAVTGDDESDLSKGSWEKAPTKYSLDKTSIFDNKNIRNTTKDSYTPLHLAAIAGQRTAARKLLNLGVNVDIETRELITPLILALGYEAGDEVTQLLLDYGANPKQKSTTGWRPLLAAVFGGKLERLKELVNKGEDLEALGDDGWSAISVAASKGFADVVQYLIDQNVDLTVKTKADLTPLDVASAHGHTEVVKLLLNRLREARGDAGPNGKSALMLAAGKCHVSTVRTLAQVSNLDAQDVSGYTALVHAIKAKDFEGNDLPVSEKLEVCRILVEAGARVDIPDNEGLTPLNHAKQNKLAELGEWLERQLPSAWHLDEVAHRRDSISSNLDKRIPWPVEPYLKAKWTEVKSELAVMSLNRVTELELAQSKAPFALTHSVRRLRSANLACLQRGWCIYEALLEVPLQKTLAVLTFLTNKEALVIMDGNRQGLDELIQQEAVTFDTTQAIEDYARLFATYVQRGLPGRLIEHTQQLPWKRGESPQSHGSRLKIQRINADLDLSNNQIIVRGTFLDNSNLVNGQVTIPIEKVQKTSFERLDKDKPSAPENEKIAGPLPLRDEPFRNALRLVGDGIRDGRTPERRLVTAAQEGNLFVVESLIKQGIFIDKPFLGETALQVASRAGHLQVVRRLVTAGADLQGKSFDGQTVLHMAANHGREEIVQLLLDPSLHLDVNAHDDEGRTALILAAEGGHTGVATLILDHGAHPERQDNDGKTALFYAIQAGCEEIVNLLIPLSNVRRETESEQTPLIVCADSSKAARDNIYSALLAAGAAPPDIFKHAPKVLPLFNEPTTELVARAMQQYSEKEGDLNWPLLPALQDEWHPVPKDTAMEIASKLVMVQVSRKAERMFSRSLILGMRSINTPYYPNRRLIEILLQPIFRLRQEIVSCLMVKEFSLKSEIEEFVLLNGTSPPLHRLNSKEPFNCDSEPLALAYLRFFCSYVWGVEGAFWIVDSSEWLPWTGAVDTEIRTATNKFIRKPELMESGKEGYKFRVSVLYGRCLFEAQLLVPSSGVPKMLEDERQLHTELPIMSDKRAGFYRIIPAGLTN